MRVIEMMQVTLKPLSFEEYAEVELRIKVRVGGVENNHSRILNIDHFKSRFDHIFEIGRDELKRLVFQGDEKGE